MKKNYGFKTKILSLFLALTFMIVPMVTVSANTAGTEPMIVVSEITGAPGSTVSVNIDLVNNPGIVSMTLRMSYDDELLTFDEIKDAGVLGTTSHKPELVNPYTLVWVNDTATSNYTVNGTVATLVFTISSEAEIGTVIPIEITYTHGNYDIYDKDANEIEFGIDNGCVQVGEAGPNAIEDFDYTVSGTEMTIIGYIGTSTDVVIGSTYTVAGTEYTVTEIGYEAFIGQDTLTSVVIPETVTLIGEAAFYDCTSLTEVTILSKDVVIEAVALGYYYSNRKEYIVEGFTIKGYADSGAETYASTSDEITFIEIIEECSHTGGTATCISGAICDLCGEEYGSIDPANHTSTEISESTDATCTEIGKTVTICSDCGKTVSIKDTPALGHNYSSVTVAPTCTGIGYTLYECIRCDSSYTSNTVPATGHSMEVSENVSATCDEDGYTINKCVNCDYSTTDTTPALGHNYVSTIVAPTCTSEGYTLHECTRCGDSYTSDTVQTTNHNMIVSENVAATCTDDGYVKYECSMCDNTTTDTLPALGHNYVSSIIAPTCLDDGYTLYKCRRCNDSYTSNTVTATGHSYAVIEEVKANCGEDGYIKYGCSGCDDEYTDIIPSAGTHDYSVTIVAPTCTVIGYTQYECSYCGYSYTDSTVPATGHNFVPLKVIAPTCIDGGYTSYGCSTCGLFRGFQDFTDATGHDWDDGVVINSATALETGIMKYTCNTCGETKEEIIPATSKNVMKFTTDKQSYTSGDTVTITVSMENIWGDPSLEGAIAGFEDFGEMPGAYGMQTFCSTLIYNTDVFTANAHKSLISSSTINNIGASGVFVKASNPLTANANGAYQCSVSSDILNENGDGYGFFTGSGDLWQYNLTIAEDAPYGTYYLPVGPYVFTDGSDNGKIPVISFTDDTSDRMWAWYGNTDSFSNDRAVEYNTGYTGSSRVDTADSVTGQYGTTYECSYVVIVVECPHENVETFTLFASCSSDGTQYTQCTDCSKVVSKVTVPAYNHKYDDGTYAWSEEYISKYPTYEEVGYYSVKCNRCGKVQNVREIEKLIDPNFTIIDGVLYEYLGEDSVVTIPYYVKTIAENAFAESSIVTTVIIPDNVTVIEEGAFANMTSLSEIAFVGGESGWNGITKADGWDNGSEYTFVYAELVFTSASTTIQNDLRINYKVNKDLFEKYGYENPYVVFSMDGTETIVTDYTVIDNSYVFSFDDISPKMMNDTISAVVYAEYNGKNYTYEISQYSIAQYCYNLLDTYIEDEYAELRTLLVDMLNYGSASQTYTGYNTDNLANADLTETQASWGTSTVRELESKLDTDYRKIYKPTVSWKGAGLVLGESVGMRFKFNADSADGLTVKITSDTGEWTLDTFEEIDGAYYAYFDKFTAAQMSKIVYVTVYDGNTAVSNTLSYSIESYIYSMKDYDPALTELLYAMMKYGDSAAAYVN